MPGLLAMALGGAALGALANKKNRKEGALMGLGLGLTVPAVGAVMGAGVPAGATAPTGLMAKMNTAAGAQMSGLGSMLTSKGTKEAAKQTAISSAPVLLQSALEETPAPQPGRSLAMDNRAAGAPVDLYAQAAINRQQRMKRGLPGRRLS
jgi:hypothetical protein